MNKILIILSLLLFSCGIDSTNNQADADKSSAGSASYDYNAMPANVEFEFIASHDGNLEDYKHKALILLKNYVEANSNGRVGISIYPNGQLAGSVNERIDGIVQQSIDIVNTTGDVSSYWEPISIFDLPYMVTNDRLVETIFSDPSFIGDLRKGALAATDNARLMVVTNSGRWRNFATSKKDIQSVADLQGLKIRTVSSKVQQQLVTAVGASPTSMAWGDLYTSLSTGVVDGTKNGVVDIVNAKLYESLNYIVLDNHAYMAGYWWMNNEKFNTLPNDLKQVMVDGFDALSWFIREYNKYDEASAYEVFKQNGGTIYRPTESELAEFKQAAQPVFDWFTNTASEETLMWLGRYQDEIEQKKKDLQVVRSLELQ